MKKNIWAFPILILLPCISAAQTQPVSQTEAQRWIRNLLPLPHEIRFKGKIELPPEAISIVLRKDADEIEKSAAGLVRGLFEEKAGTAPEGKSFEIWIGVATDDSGLGGQIEAAIERLNSVPNKDQAYVICPQDGRRLILSGLNGKGVFYAAVTLCQLLKPYLTPQRAVIPLPEIVDWPDLEERGLWNFPDPVNWIPWLVSMKLNYGKMADTRI